MRTFSEPQWWLIGEEEKGQAATPRKRAKPELFQKMCTDRHEEMRKVYESAMSRDSEQCWLRKVSSEGTSGDRVASLTMLIQVCPVFSTPYIKSLLSMASKAARSDSVMAVDALKDLFISNLLPDRKLKTFVEMEPISPKGMKKSAFTELCVRCFFEDFLKTAFAAFVQVLGEAAHNAVTFFKTKAVRIAYELLSAKPEQEKALLGLLVNKFGDTAPKVSSNVSYCIKQLLQAHPGMKLVVAKEVEAFLARPNITERSQYFSVLLLSEFTFARNDSALAAHIIRIFVVRLEEALKRPMLLKKKGVSWHRWEKRRYGKRPTSKVKKALTEDDNRLIRALINGIQRAIPYLDTVAGAPLQEETVNALYRVCHVVSAFSTRISILSLLHRCIQSGESPDRFYRLLYDQVLQFDLFLSSHRNQVYNLLRKCIPKDALVGRCVAIVRRLLQVGAHNEPPVAVAALTVMKDLMSLHSPEVKPLLSCTDATLPQSDEPAGAMEDEDVEHFVDDDVAEAQGAAMQEKNDNERDLQSRRKMYLPTTREPRFAAARSTPLWELHALCNHVHPFVATGASAFLGATAFDVESGNPFETFSCGELLEQFTYATRTQKTRKDRFGRETEGAPIAPVNSEKFARRKRVPPHERFFQLYFQDKIVRAAQKQKLKSRREKEEDFDEQGGREGEVDDTKGDAEDAFFDNYLKGELGDVDLDDEGEEEGSDIDDDDFGEGEEEGFGDVPADEDAEDEAVTGDDLTLGQRPGKRKALSELPKQERIKALKKQHAGAMFASIEDFEQLIAEDEMD